MNLEIVYPVIDKLGLTDQVKQPCVCVCMCVASQCRLHRGDSISRNISLPKKKIAVKPNGSMTVTAVLPRGELVTRELIAT